MAATARSERQKPVAADQIRVWDLMPKKWRKSLPQIVELSASRIEKILIAEDVTHPKWQDILDFIEADEKRKRDNARRTVELKNRMLKLVYNPKK